MACVEGMLRCLAWWVQLWKAEEKAAKEKRSLEELRKAYAEEREREELRGVAVAAGHMQCALGPQNWSYKTLLRCTQLWVPGMAQCPPACCRSATRQARFSLLSVD